MINFIKKYKDHAEMFIAWLRAFQIVLGVCYLYAILTIEDDMIKDIIFYSFIIVSGLLFLYYSAKIIYLTKNREKPLVALTDADEEKVQRIINLSRELGYDVIVTKSQKKED